MVAARKGVDPAALTWTKLVTLTRDESDLGRTLCGGQSFRWRLEEEGCWSGVVGQRAYMLRQTETHVMYRRLGNNEDKDDSEVLRSYLRLDADLPSLYSEWCRRDKAFQRLTANMRNVRLLNQDPVETTFAFICSSNNNVSRIWSMVEKLCLFYGPLLATVPNGRSLHGFPPVSHLTAADVESKLRSEGFGYRAQYICKAAKQIEANGGESWLRGLAQSDGGSPSAAREALIGLSGVGPKVADCVLLMGLGYLDVVPVDTHVRQVASKVHSKGSTSKSLTPHVYQEVSDFYKKLYGECAGWAQAMLFASDLKNLSEPKKETMTKSRKRKMRD